MEDGHYSQEERIKRFGIECIGPSGDGILFKAGHWRPGGEYIQKLIIRNVSTSVKKLKYKLPSTRYFSMAYPEVITLSPGIFKEVDVVFRPVEHEPYDDTIYIKMLDGIEGNGFHVPVGATIDKLILKTPEGLDFGYCPTHQTTELTFHLVNAGEVDAPYEWQVPEPFHFSPSHGVVPVGKFHEITVSIWPEDASVFVSKAVCQIGQGVHAIIPEPVLETKLSAIGKYAFITLSESLISFGEVVSGTKPEKQEIMLYNKSVVPAEFSLIRYDNDRDEVFDIEPKAGIILPNSELPVTIHYHALAMGCYTLDRYCFRTPGNCTTMLTCKGLSMPPKIMLFKESVLRSLTEGSLTGATSQSTSLQQLSATLGEGAPAFSLNFRDVEVRLTETRVLFLKNDSHRDTPFCVIADESGVFHIHPKQGVIPSLTKGFPVTVSFSPTRPINFYRRFFVLVGDSLPLFFDCLGTGFIRARGEVKEQRPAPIRHAHVQAFRNRSVQGFGFLSPEELDRLNEDRNTPSQFFAHVGRDGTRAMSVTALQQPVTRTGESIRNLVAPAHEFFINDTDASQREISSSRLYLDFGYTPYHRTSTGQTIVVHNNTNGKVVVQWFIPSIHRVSSGQDSIRDSTAADEEEKTRQAKKERSLVASDVDADEANQKQHRAFDVQPLLEEINPGKSATFEVHFCPKQSNRNFVSELEAYVYFKNQRTFRLVNDFSLTPPWCLTLPCLGHTFGSGQLLAKAKILGGNIRDGKLIFPCGFTGESLYQTFTVRNTSNLPCTFHVRLGFGTAGEVPDHTFQDEIFSVKPSVGEIDANGFVLLCVRFSPKSTRKYHQLLRLLINGDEGDKLMLEGAGAVPYLLLPDMVNDDPVDESVLGVSSRPMHLVPQGPQGAFYLKPTCIGLSTCRKMRLKNGSRLPLKFRVQLSGNTDGLLLVSPMHGILKGNEESSLALSFSPQANRQYKFQLKVLVYPIGGKPMQVKDANQPGPVEEPELLQKLSVSIMAVGDLGALVFDPSRLTVNVRLVDTEEAQDVFIENVSDADLYYQLLYKEEFESDNTTLRRRRAVSGLMPLVPKHSFEVDEIPHKEASQEVPYNHSLFCNKPIGTLAARSRARLVFSYLPKKSGLFEFLIFAQVKAIDRTTGKPVMISNDEAALLRLSQQDQLHDSQPLSPSTLPFDPQYTSNLAMLPLMTNITARAAYPRLLFEDIRMDYDGPFADIDYLWNKFSLAQINYDLSVPLSSQEVHLNHSSSPDTSQIKKYTFEFPPAMVNSPMQTVRLRLRNNGYLTTALRFNFPNEKQLDLENWCDEDEPTEENNRLISIIEELKLFSLEPREATLQPGETVELKLSYSYNTLKYKGEHNVPVLVKLSQGKQFYIDLVGRTLPSPHSNILNKNRKLQHNSSVATPLSRPGSKLYQPNTIQEDTTKLVDYLLASSTGTDRVLRLAPVPIGLVSSLAPLQRTEIINPSGSPVNYEVDTKSLQQFCDDNFHLPLVRVSNPSGSISAQSSTFLEWYFYPLEAKTYTFSLRIKYTPIVSVLPESPENDNMSRGGIRRVNISATSSPTPSSRRGVGDFGNRDRSSSSASLMPGHQVLDLIVQCQGYDPRTMTRPIPFESLYEGGLAPRRPLVSVDNQLVHLSEDMLHFDIVPQRTVSKKIIVLENNSPNAAYDFMVDEGSCVLSLDGFLSIQPSSGRIDPGACKVLEFSFHALCQPMIFQEKIKLILREIIRTTHGNRKGGMRQRLMSKIKVKSKNSESSQHVSVVSRPTFSRSLQIEHTALQTGLQTSLPVTVNQDGEVISASRSQLLTRSASFESEFEEELNIEGSGSKILQATEVNQSSQFLNSRSNRPGGGISFSDFAPRNYSATKSPHPTSPGTNLGATRALSPGSRGDLSEGGSRGGFLSSRAGSEFSRKSNESAPILLGAPVTLNIRLKGEVFTIETIQSLFSGDKEIPVSSTELDKQDTDTRRRWRHGNQHEDETNIDDLGSEEDQLNEDEPPAQPLEDLYRISPHLLKEVFLPDRFDFIPPVGQKIFDAEFIQSQETLHNKAKLNIEFIKGRDAELREITQAGIEVLFKDLLSGLVINDCLESTLSDTNTRSIPGIEHSDFTEVSQPFQSKLRQASAQKKYGVYFNEVQRPMPLLDQLVAELRRLGYSNTTQTTEQTLQDIQGSSYDGAFLQNWTGFDETQRLSFDSSAFSLPSNEFLEALDRLGIQEDTSQPVQDIFSSVQATSITMKPPRLHHASSVDSLLDESSMRESIMVNKRLHVASFIQNLSLEAHLYLRQVLNSIADCRRGPTQVQRSSTTMLDEAVGEAKTNTSSQSLKPTEPSRKMPPAPPAIEIDDPLEEKEHPLKYSKQQFVNSQDFVETSFFVLNDVFVNLLQDLVNSNET